ncbi:lysylphosphatidylglycerol synthase transmembrane domain-containing protein [Acidobacteriota bacterium]
MKKAWVRFGIVFLLTAVFIFFFFKSVDWKDVLSNLTNVNPFLFALASLLALLHLVTRSIRWQYLLRYEKKKVSFWNRIAANAVGFTVTFIFPGRLGEIVRPLYLARKEGLKKGFTVGTIIVERIFDVFTNCLLLGLFLVSRPLFPSYYSADEQAYSEIMSWGIVGIAIASSLLLFIFSLYFFQERALSVFAFILRPFPKKISEKVIGLLKEFIEGLQFFHSVLSVFVYILLSIFVWLGIIFFYWVFFLAYNVSLPYFSLIPFIFLTGAGASIPTPGMVGGYHYFSRLGMTRFLNIEDSLAVSLTIVQHAVQLVVTCLLGYAILWKEGLSLLQIKKLGEERDQ